MHLNQTVSKKIQKRIPAKKATNYSVFHVYVLCNETVQMLSNSKKGALFGLLGRGIGCVCFGGWGGGGHRQGDCGEAAAQQPPSIAAVSISGWSGRGCGTVRERLLQ